MIEQNLIQQVKGIYTALESQYVLRLEADPAHESFAEFKEFFNDFASTSDHIAVEVVETPGTLRMVLVKDGKDTGVIFRCIPGGHEFTSLLLAVYNADGKGKALPDEAISRRIKALKGPIHLTTYVSLSCTNCPDVVQALNVMALLHGNFTHEIVDGALFQAEADALHLQGVPAVMHEGKLVHGGRGEMAGLLDELEEKFGTETANLEAIRRNYDVVVIGGGPAGSAAAIYSARKGLNVAIVAERIGGQVKDTVGIENLISVPQTTGAELASNLGKHIGAYPIDVFENRKIESAALHGCPKEISVKGGETFVAVHFCPHCDGPFYKGKRVAVIGGGNSGIEAALDLAGICSHVTVLEFADKLLADNVLQEKARATENIEIFTMSQTTAVLGDGQKVTGLRVKDRNTEQEREISLDGIFVQIGLAPNTQAFADQLELSPRREIQVDRTCRTSVSGVYAAGDCTDVPYKQIVVAIGEGAKASLSAFDDRVRGVIG